MTDTAVPATAREPFLTADERVLGVLLVFVPIAIGASRLGAPPWLQFAASVAAVIPLAGFIGSATESLAERTGGRVGGLLNATFGNAPDLLVGVFGVQKGLIPLVKATLIGALISNSALVMGLCCLLAGLVHGRPRFRRQEAGHHSVLMMLTLAAVLFPSVGASVLCGGPRCTVPQQSNQVQTVSVGIAVALLVAYMAYVLYSILGFEKLRRRNPREVRSGRFRGGRPHPEKQPRWPLWLSLGVLAGSTALLVPVVDVLTGSVEPVTKLIGWSEVFVGIIVVANAGNIAEAYAAIKFAVLRPAEGSDGSDSGLDLSLAIASASSIQIATFIAPVVVLYSLFQHPMNLVFSPVEVAILGLLVILFAYIAQDGESNWLEGVQLLVLYAMAAIVFFVLPVSVFG
jgi:Ca2+:H+ antiporter